MSKINLVVELAQVFQVSLNFCNSDDVIVRKSFLKNIFFYDLKRNIDQKILVRIFQFFVDVLTILANKFRNFALQILIERLVILLEQDKQFIIINFMNVQHTIAFDSFHEKTPSAKLEEHTAAKDRRPLLDETQCTKIRNFIFSLFKQDTLRGHIKVQNFESLEVIEVIFYHKIKQYNIQQSIKINFGSNYPSEPPKLEVHACNLTVTQPQYKLPEFLTFHELLNADNWSESVNLTDAMAKIYQNIDDFHKSQVERLLSPRKYDANGQQSCQSLENMQIKDEEKSMQKFKRQRRKSSNMTGCADKELTQTKNLNRHFRSKLREVLRDMTSLQSTQQVITDAKFIDQIFTPNRVGFEDIRKALYNKWFNEGVRRQMGCGMFLHKILRGMMGIKSKKLMIKYYHVMVSAVEEPSSFIRWKYD